uniref:Uncharacterized protein n=1 Tax=Erpetoichthys calabaricus TaxID=27687 RepID=A0A8C4SEB4_ERPCA
MGDSYVIMAVGQEKGRVQVEDGDLVFSLDSVKTLGNLMAASGGVKKELGVQGTFSVCTTPALPKERHFFKTCMKMKAKKDGCHYCTF